MTKYCTLLVAVSATQLAIFAPTPVARADIFKWEYVNPANPALGKQQSTILTPGGAGVNAAPGANLWFRNLTMAYLIGADLSGAGVGGANLTNAELSQTNLTNAYFGAYYDEISYYSGADLTGANLTGAEVRGANFLRFINNGVGGISLTQLYSTASYQAHDLTGIGLGENNLFGVNLASQNLTNADFTLATLRNAGRITSVSTGVRIGS
jgi:hypothetical protein